MGGDGVYVGGAEPLTDPENRVHTIRAEGQLYQGAAGIAWFLGELYRATGDAEVGRAARGGNQPGRTMAGKKLSLEVS